MKLPWQTLSRLIITGCGLTSYVCLMIAEATKPQQSTIPVSTENGFLVCHYPKDRSPLLSAIASSTMLLAAIFACFYASVPLIFKTFKVFVPHHRIGVYLWFFFAWLTTLTSVIVTCFASWQQNTHYRSSDQQINGPDGALPSHATDAYAAKHPTAWNPKGVLCPTVKRGIFGGMGFIMLGSTALWVSFTVMADTARELFNSEEEESIEKVQVSLIPLVPILPGQALDEGDLEPTDDALTRGAYAPVLK